MTIRWEEEARTAAEHLGWEVRDVSGVDDYQGWGVLLLHKAGDELGQKDRWATLGWSYGSCGGCDAYEDMNLSTPQACADAFGELVEEFTSVEKALASFSDRKGW